MRVPLNVVVLSETKFTLESLAAMLQRPQGAVVDLMTTAYLASLPSESRTAIEGLKAASAFHAARLDAPNTSAPPATYSFSRLGFRRDVIESLGQDHPFRIVTPIGTFQMTKSEFYREFSNVVNSKSYSERGLYHYPTLPAKAEQFRIA
ncbi:MAG: hypothetical protein NTV52_25255 [Acidobacteria bacterium]|nr:hypothetical protein [Acidobacteriota bacterium]